MKAILLTEHTSEEIPTSEPIEVEDGIYVLIAQDTRLNPESMVRIFVFDGIQPSKNKNDKAPVAKFREASFKFITHPGNK